ncbi:MAG: acetyl-CoA C-acetyltransferase [Pseudonocardiales bacterium]|jgi:acetyl-CoA C-acetyltransferase|nr:acetyl-CoA C-acetyltransferase [Pseudonocardiales bacterium]
MMLVASGAKAEELGLPVAGRLVSAVVTGVDPSVMGLGMISASRRALAEAELDIGDLDLVEANEAFAAIAVAVARELEVPEEKMNALGGAVALGHPIRATGAILAVKILHELKRRAARYGLVTLCIGGGMGIAAIVEHVS